MSHNKNAKLMVLDELRKGTCPRTVSEISGIPYKTVWRWMNDSDDPIINKNRVMTRYHHTKRAMVEEWFADKTPIHAVYSSQGKCLIKMAKMSSPGKESFAVGTPDDRDTRQYIRDLKDENEFLKAKVAYLEALMELNGTPVSSFKKKRNTRPSAKSSEEELET